MEKKFETKSLQDNNIYDKRGNINEVLLYNYL